MLKGELYYDDIIIKLDKGVSLKEICETFNLARNHIYSLLKKNTGMGIREYIQKRVDETYLNKESKVKRAIQLYREGYSSKEIAEDLSITPHYLKKILNEQGWHTDELLAKGKKTYKIKKDTYLRDMGVVTKYLNFISSYGSRQALRLVADEKHLEEAHVYSILKKYGLTNRDEHSQMSFYLQYAADLYDSYIIGVPTSYIAAYLKVSREFVNNLFNLYRCETYGHEFK